MGRKKGIRIGATVGMVVGAYQLWKDVSGAGTAAKASTAIQSLTGYNINDGSWDWRRARAAVPMVAGVGLSMVASKTGLNRYTPTGINI